MYSASVYEALLNMFSSSGFPQQFKVDGAAYFISAEFKGLMAHQNTLIKCISPYRSNANICERQIRTIKDFLKRSGKPWTDAENLYNCQLYCNSFCNVIKSNKFGDICPYMLNFGMKPQVLRHIRCKKPLTDGERPIQVFIEYEELEKELNANSERKLPKIKLSDYKEGTKCHYKSRGRKPGRLLEGLIVKPESQTVTIKNS